MTKREALTRINFGARVAEEEADQLGRYFVETDTWRRLFAGDIDVIYGAKGSGKSALYALLVQRKDELFDSRVVLIPAENPRGTTAFKDLVADPPTSENEFNGLWKLFFASLIGKAFDDYGIDVPAARTLRAILAREGLIPADWNLRKVLRRVVDYVRPALRPQALSAGVQLDPNSGLPTGFEGRITFREPASPADATGFRSVDRLLELADDALQETGFSVWLLQDRLDVAFAENSPLEENALRALFRVYLDMAGLRNIKLKIFLRSDIWRRITQSGFREASHITRHVVITWDRATLLNLVVSRCVQNEAIREFYAVDSSTVLGTAAEQSKLFSRMCPDQVDVGPNKSQTFDWVLGRTTDGTKETAPREVIHFFNSLRVAQVRRLEIGEPEPEGEALFARAAFKEALHEVSHVRLEQTLYAEYPSLKPVLERLRGEKTKQTVQTLAVVWGVPAEVAQATAEQLSDAGFFEPRGPKTQPEYWVPFLYRDALDLVQGTAEADVSLNITEQRAP